MKMEGPQLEILTRRVAECPVDFLAEPRIGAAGSIPVAAIVSDLIRDLGGDPLTLRQSTGFSKGDAKIGRNHLRLVLITCWLFHDPWFLNRKECANLLYLFLTGPLTDLSATTAAEKFVSEPDRREELVRFCLKELDLRPAGETIAQAQDRLATLSTAERRRVIRAAREAEERARAIREAMVRRAADEAAAKASRE